MLRFIENISPDPGVVGQREAERHEQKVEEVVVARQHNDDH